MVVVCKEGDHAQFGGEEGGARGVDARCTRECTSPDRGDRMDDTAAQLVPVQLCPATMAQQLSVGHASGHKVSNKVCFN